MSEQPELLGEHIHELRLATGTGDLLDLKGICGDSSETVLQRLCGRNAISGPPPPPPWSCWGSPPWTCRPGRPCRSCPAPRQ